MTWLNGCFAVSKLLALTSCSETSSLVGVNQLTPSLPEAGRNMFNLKNICIYFLNVLKLCPVVSVRFPARFGRVRLVLTHSTF